MRLASSLSLPTVSGTSCSASSNSPRPAGGSPAALPPHASGRETGCACAQARVTACPAQGLGGGAAPRAAKRGRPSVDSETDSRLADWTVPARGRVHSKP
eukprot:5511563-Prymnesium_polylepis.1